MNERIQELMGNTLDEKFAGTWSTMDMQDLQKFAERFAELIVKECMEEVMTYQHHRNATREMVPFIVEDIKLHFGVEP